MKAVMMPIEKLVEDFKLYPRTDVDEKVHVTNIAEAILAGVPIPPIVADVQSYRIVDGWHRKRAYQRLKYEAVPCILKQYDSEADMFEDAVRLNATHGRPLSMYERKRCIEIAQELGLSLERITKALAVRVELAEKWIATFATDSEGKVHAVKANLISPSETWTRRVEEANRKWMGNPPAFLANQLLVYLEGGFFKPTDTKLAKLLDRLVEVWQEVKARVAVGSAESDSLGARG